MSATGAAPAAGPVPGRRQIERGSLPRHATWAMLAAVGAAALALLLLTSLNPALLLVGWVAVSGVTLFAWSRLVEGSRASIDRGIAFGVGAAFAVAVTPLVSLLYTVVAKGSQRFDLTFFTSSARNVVGEGGGALHAILGTLVITAIATLASVPIGIMAAVYLHEYGRGRLRKALTFFVDVMTGIPSIVAGLFAYALFALFLGPGVRLGVIGAVALSVLMLPIVVRSTEEVLKIVPGHLREASYALGVPKWRTVVKVVLPTALAGIITGVMLAIARIVGETAPLLITTGVFSSVNLNPFDGRMQNLAVFAYTQYANPGALVDPYVNRAWAAALTLIAIVMTLNLVARLVYRRFGAEIR